MDAREVIAIDIGATNVRFSRASLDGDRPDLGEIRRFKVADFATFQECWQAYAASEDDALPTRAMIALACPVTGGVIKLTNAPWTFDPATLADELGLESVGLINDLAATAHAITMMPLDNLELLFGPKKALPRTGVVTIVGPGTGLGVGMIVFNNGIPQVVPTEGGHIDFPAYDQLEARLVKGIRTALRVERVSAERIVSGHGLNRLYQALAALSGTDVPEKRDDQLWASALDGSDPLARAALERFCLAYGSVAGDLALAQGAQTVVLVGRLSERLRDFLLTSSGFRPRFVAKGRFQDFMQRITVRLARMEEIGLYGAATAALRAI